MAQKIQFLRNATISANKSDALVALKTKLASETLSGEPIVNMYYDSVDGSTVIKALVGVVTKNGGYTILSTTDTTGEAISDAIGKLDYTDAAVADNYVSSVSETDGVISVTRVALPVKSVASSDKTVTVVNTDGAVDIKVNVDGETIVKDDTSGVLSVSSKALTQYVGENAINVSDVDADNNKTISLKIKDGDKVLAQSADGLSASISMAYDATKKEIKLMGASTTEAISTIDASDFIKDGMLAGEQVFLADAASKEVTFTIGGETKSHTYENLTVGNHYIAFCFKIDGKEVTYSFDILDATTIIDVYNGTTDEIDVKDHVISLAQKIKDELAAVLDEISVSTTEVDAKGYVTAKVSAKADKKQEVGVGVTYGSFKTDDAEQVNGIATVEAVNDVIVANEKVTSAALNKLNSDINTLDNSVVKSVVAGDASVSVSKAGNEATIKVNIDGKTLVLDATNNYIYVDTIDGGEY